MWSDQTGARDMPWLANGERARWFTMDKTKPWDIMNPRGPEIEKRWGGSGRSGSSPYGDAERAMEYLASTPFMKAWPAYPPDSSQKEAIAFPFRATIVAIQPTVVVLRFDLSGAIEDPTEFSWGAFPKSQEAHFTDQGLGWPKTPNRVMFGTHVVSRGSMWWFCPEENIPPTPLDMSSGTAQIALKDFKLAVLRKGDEIEFAWRKR